ncbi:hypothetical protein DY000_02037098 [Brassica cretica]|uniref:glucan endo-1,3-beta-D-glucosidase n=1 Tax=Brassica cretica TaxID=69181 RepID=A0ABQ7BG81_BRACR|nr:hypothetical protein DY000_02037098 [Brassica cretica]
MGERLKLILWICLSILAFLDSGAASKIGICYGRNADNLPSPNKVSDLIQHLNIKFVRIYDANIDVLKAFANTGIELMIGVPNADLLAFAQFQSNVDTWLHNNILPYYPTTKITSISVGLEVTEAPDNATGLLLPAMRNIHTALKKSGLDKKIKISSSHSLAILSRSFPPSSATFSKKHSPFLKPMLEFLVENESPFMIDLYPYYAYRDSSEKVQLEYALFESSSQVVDPATDTVLSHASYAFNTYYQQSGANSSDCSFGGVSVEVDKDPSYGNCLYMIAPSTDGMNRTMAGNITGNITAIDSPMASPSSSSEGYRQMVVSVTVSVLFPCFVVSLSLW